MIKTLERILLTLLVAFIIFNSCSICAYASKYGKCMHSGCGRDARSSGYCSRHDPDRYNCCEEGCSKTRTDGSYCREHYEIRMKKRWGTVPKARSECKSKGCTRLSTHDGYCYTHNPDKNNCCHPGCNKKKTYGSYCDAHYSEHATVKTKKEFTSTYSKQNYHMPDCDDYEDDDDFIDDWDGNMPDGSDAEDYWDNW